MGKPSWYNNSKRDSKKIEIKPKIKIRLIIETPQATKVKDIFGKIKFKEPLVKLLKNTDKTLDIAF